MNKMKFMLFAVAAMAAASCVKETAPEGQDNPASEVNYVQMEFTVDTKTKTAIAEDGATVLWNTNDKVAVYDNSATASAHINEFTVVYGSGSSSAVIQGTVPEDATEFYAYYPYNANRTFVDGVVEAYVDETPGNTYGAFPAAVMMAKADADGNFAFKNVCSHIKFTLAEDMTDIKSIILMGNNAETIAGYCDVAWNNGEPVITPASNAVSYVKIVKTSGLNPGDYYFSIFPTDFTEGFTIVLTKTDGTQLMKKTTKSYDLSARNTILPMKLVASNDYDECTNYYVKYINDEDITIGGYTFNKTAEKTAVVVSDLKDNTNLSADGLYFVAPATDNVQIRGTHSKYMVIGMEKGCRVPTTLANQMSLTNAGTVCMLANLSVENGSSYNILRGSPATFGSYIVSDCYVYNINRGGLFDMANGTLAESSTFDRIVIEDSEISHSRTSDKFMILNRGSKSNPITVKEYVLHNNVFCSSVVTTTKHVGLSYGEALKLNNISVTNNTFDVTVSGTFFHCNSSSATEGSLIFDNNLFDSYIISQVTILSSKAGSGSVSNNYFYNENTALTTSPVIRVTTTNAANLDYTAPVKLSKSPLNIDSWRPAEGSFGAYTITPVEGEAPTVPVGAQRADMAVVTSSVNSPAADYKTADLGTF